jgi:hypothetical protein
MQSRAFAAGVADVRASRGYRPSYDRQNARQGRIAFTNAQWDYERGRQWAVAAGPDVPLRAGGKISPEAEQIFIQAGIR